MANLIVKRTSIGGIGGKHDCRMLPWNLPLYKIIRVAFYVWLSSFLSFPIFSFYNKPHFTSLLEFQCFSFLHFVEYLEERYKVFSQFKIMKMLKHWKLYILLNKQRGLFYFLFVYSLESKPLIFDLLIPINII